MRHAWAQWVRRRGTLGGGASVGGGGDTNPTQHEAGSAWGKGRRPRLWGRPGRPVLPGRFRIGCRRWPGGPMRNGSIGPFFRRLNFFAGIGGPGREGSLPL